MNVPKKKARKSRPLVLGYLERISSKIFSDFPKQLTDLIGKQHGVYALYKGTSLYYVGLATNLRGRIKQHLRDKHAGKWDKFSLYLVRKADHIKELETLIMRVANPTGNVTGGRLPKADNLKSELETNIKTEQIKQLKKLLGTRLTLNAAKKSQRKVKRQLTNGKPTLAPYIKKGFPIKGTYKGKTYKAVVNKSGSIRFNGKLYNSPSMSGKAARNRTTNGWIFWHYKNSKGEWVKLDELRKNNGTNRQNR